MITKQKQQQCVKEMKQTFKNPFYAIKTLHAIKHNIASAPSFVGYTAYFLNIIQCDIHNFTHTTSYKQRTEQLNLIQQQIQYCWTLGIIDDTQKALITCAVKTIHQLIKHYLPIYIIL